MINTIFPLRPAVSVVAASLLLALASGCASKKHVSTKIAPLERRIGELEGKASKTETAIADLQQGVSRADEHAGTAEAKAGMADGKAVAAAEQAQRAGQRAEAAERAAGGARQVAEQGLTRTAELEQRIAGLEDYQLVGREVVYFPVGKSELSADAKRQLDSAASTIMKHRRYVLEVQGFTDKTGNPSLNLELSRRRANAVVRYLTIQHKVPLFRIQMLGFGDSVPLASDRTAAGRKQNRRVEIKLFSADGAGAGKNVPANGAGL